MVTQLYIILAIFLLTTDFTDNAILLNNIFTQQIVIDTPDQGNLTINPDKIVGNQENLSITTTSASTLNLNINKTSGDLYINDSSSASTYVKNVNVYLNPSLNQIISWNDTTKTIISSSITTSIIYGTATKATAITDNSNGSILHQQSTNITTFLPIGSNGKVLKSNGSTPFYDDNISNSIYGSTLYSLLYQSALNTTSFVSNGTTGQILKSNGSAPNWADNVSNAISANSTGQL